MTLLRSAIIIVVDGLPASALGTYGNQWLPTMAFNKLASQSLVVEFPWLDTLQPLGLATSALWGRHALCPQPPAVPSLLASLREMGVQSRLFTDDRKWSESPLANEFTQCEWISMPSPVSAANSLDETHVARFMDAAAHLLVQQDSPSVSWIQYRGFQEFWDAPWELRALLADESDPPPPHGIQPACQTLQCDDDPDIALAAMQCFGAQVMALDSAMGEMMTLLDRVWDPQSTLLIFTSCRGCALGEHRVIGAEMDQLYSETVHVPLLIRGPRTLTQPYRLPCLAQPADLFATIAESFGLPTDRRSTGAYSLWQMSPFAPLCRRAVTVSSTGYGIRTPSWYLLTPPPPSRQSVAPGGASPTVTPELFAKPDDRWDANDLAQRCPEIVLNLQAELDMFLSAASIEQLDQLADLPSPLTAAHS